MTPAGCFQAHARTEWEGELEKLRADWAAESDRSAAAAAAAAAAASAAAVAALEEKAAAAMAAAEEAREAAAAAQRREEEAIAAAAAAEEQWGAERAAFAAAAKEKIDKVAAIFFPQKMFPAGKRPAFDEVRATGACLRHVRSLSPRRKAAARRDQGVGRIARLVAASHGLTRTKSPTPDASHVQSCCGHVAFARRPVGQWPNERKQFPYGQLQLSPCRSSTLRGSPV